MARIHDLLRSVATSNEGLADEIRREIDATYGRRRAFGLNFERHTPEAVELPSRVVRKGDKVHILPTRGETVKAENKVMWFVESVDRKSTPSTAEIVRSVNEKETETRTIEVEDLVVVAEFRDPIYPGLVSTGKVELGGNKPFHLAINAENFHALQALLFTHRGKVDLIYIDPPYNTGNESWKYNDKIVDTEDDYRHSKWLAFIERRLRLAKELLSETGLILVSIDDREQARLKLLLDQVFDATNFVGTFIWRTDGNLDNQAVIKTNHEYVIAFAKNATNCKITGVKDPNIGDDSKLFLGEIRNSVVKNGPKNPPSSIRLAKGFPAAVDSARIKGRDDAWPRYNEDVVIEGGALVNEVEAFSGWASASLLKNFISGGFAPVVDSKGQLTRFEITRTGAIEGVKVRRPDQHHILTVLMNLGTVETASNVLRSVGIDFPYPKPVPLLEYLLSFGPNDGTFLDFFAGSGTTLHSLIRLNAVDGGSRTCILISNNEVDQKAQAEMRRLGLRPGDKDWEARGVFQSVTVPRTENSVRGNLDQRSNEPGPRDEGYSENLEFFTLTYESQLAVSSGRTFDRIAPLLWIRAGQTGRRIDSLDNGFDVADVYGVIADLDKTDEFVSAVTNNPLVRVVFVITEEDRLFETISQSLPTNVEVVRLFDDYLRNFEIDAMAVDR